MANGIRTDDPRGFNKGHSSKFREGSRVRQTPEEGRRTYRPKRCGNKTKDEDNCPKTINDKYIYIYIYIYIYTYTHTHTNTHTNAYVCVCVCACVCVFGQHLFVNTYLIKQNRHPLSTHFMVSGLELVHQPPIINCFPRIFCLILCYHQGCVYCKSDVIFACT